MSYTITIDFPAAYVNDSDYVELQLQFTVDLTAGNQSYQASEKNIEVMKYGTLKLQYELDDPLLVPSEMEFTIGDKAGYLDGLLYGSSAEQAATVKQFKVTLLLNGATEFVGTVDERSIKSDTGLFEVSFTATPNTVLLNEAVFNENGEPTDNFNYLNTGAQDPIYGIEQDSTNGRLKVTYGTIPTPNNDFQTGDLVKIVVTHGSAPSDAAGWKYVTRINSTSFYIDVATTQSGYFPSATIIGIVYDFAGALTRQLVFILTDAYNKVGGGIVYPDDLSVVHNWVFSELGGAPDYTFDEVSMLTTSYVAGNTLTQSPPSGLSSVKDFLKLLALHFCAFTGMIHEGKAFFHKLFYYNSGDTQTLTQVLKHEKSYRFGLLEYVLVKTISSDVVHYDAGVYTADENRRLIIEEVIPFWYTAFGGNGTNVFSTTGNNSILAGNDPSLEDFPSTYDNGKLIAEFWYHFRSNIENCRVDRMICRGVNYDFLKGTVYANGLYQIIGIEKDFEKNETIIDAIYLGVASGGGEPE